MKIVFFGDSVTDMDRNRERTDGEALSFGMGFVFIATANLQSKRNDCEIFNRGISGNKVTDLVQRLDDVILLQPDVVSILIGVNDVWHKYSHNNGNDIATYQRVYQQVISQIKAQCPNAKIMLCEPVFTHGYATDGIYNELCELSDYAKAVKRLAKDNGCHFVPLQKAFDKATGNQTDARFLYDGIHPNPAGAKLIADKWLKEFDKLGI